MLNSCIDLGFTATAILSTLSLIVIDFVVMAASGFSKAIFLISNSSLYAAAISPLVTLSMITSHLSSGRNTALGKLARANVS